jgi:hypothetical protein
MPKKAAAAYLGVTPRHTDTLREQGVPWYRIGGRVFFDPDDLDEVRARARVRTGGRDEADTAAADPPPASPAAELVRATRQAQGLPEKIGDYTTYGSVATLLDDDPAGDRGRAS